MLLLFLFMTLFITADCYTFVTTKSAYNGTIGYNGLFAACNKDYKNSKPCSVTQLLDGYWNQNVPSSWILELDINCLGYTTDSQDVFGTCIPYKAGQTEYCTCDMYMFICCYY